MLQLNLCAVPEAETAWLTWATHAIGSNPLLETTTQLLWTQGGQVGDWSGTWEVGGRGFPGHRSRMVVPSRERNGSFSWRSIKHRWIDRYLQICLFITCCCQPCRSPLLLMCKHSRQGGETLFDQSSLRRPWREQPWCGPESSSLPPITHLSVPARPPCDHRRWVVASSWGSSV